MNHRKPHVDLPPPKNRDPPLFYKEDLPLVRMLLGQPEILGHLLEHPEDFSHTLEEYRRQIQESSGSASQYLQKLSAANCFNGIITPEIRLQLVQKCKGLNTPRWRIAKYFGVTSSTLQKWLSGKTTRCSVAARRRILDFLNGNCDDLVPCPSVPAPITYYEGHLSPQARLCMEHILKIYELCETSPQQESTFLEHMESAAKQALNKIVTPILPSEEEQ